MHTQSTFTPEFAAFQARWWLTSGQDTRRWAFYSLGAQMCAMDTGEVHGPERPEILPFIATIEVRYNGAWVPEANGSSIWWLQRELDNVAQCYRRVRVVTPWREVITLDGAGS